jgi:pyruvate dehydrogenase E2 component (dihydrolipoamide acetyltransferase)
VPHERSRADNKPLEQDCAMTEITMPSLSDSMEEGTIFAWLKNDGDHVEVGEELLEIETDKVTMTQPAEAAGVLTIIVPAGNRVGVGAPIARLEPIGEISDREPAAPPSDELLALPAASDAAEPGTTTAKESESDRNAVSDALLATPLARRAARLHGVRLEGVAGSGPLGRITQADVLGRPEAPPSTVTPRAESDPSSSAPDATGKGDVVVVEPTRRQLLVARRMTEAKTTVPHFQVQTEVEMDDIVAFRAQCKDAGATVPSLNDFVVKAAALALRRHPRANGAYDDERFELYSRINIGIAVAAGDDLVVPTILDADTKPLGVISQESRLLAERVRDGTITLSELTAATFTISNLGMYGMTAIAPVINVPQAAILGVGTTRSVLARRDGEIVDRNLMTLTLSCDHRILYGAEAAQFLSTVRELLEHPMRLVM